MFTVKNESQPIQIVNQWFNVDETVDPGISYNFTLGYETKFNFFNDSYRFTAETYYKTMENLQTWPVDDDGPPITDMKINEHFDEGDAYSYGIEFLLEKQLGRLNGNISYTYSFVEKELDKKGNTFKPFWIHHMH